MTHVVCDLQWEHDVARFTWQAGAASFKPYVLDGQALANLKDISYEVREKLGELVHDYHDDLANVPRRAYELAKSGWELYQQVFDPGAGEEHEAVKVRTWLESLRHDRIVDTLEIIVSEPWIAPWNVIYDSPPQEQSFLSTPVERETNVYLLEAWIPFWGLRYNLAGGSRVDPLRLRPIVDPTILAVIDREILEGLPADQQARLRDVLELHGAVVVHSEDELRMAIKDGRPDVLYWFCHATPSALFLEEKKIDPRSLARLLRGQTSGIQGGDRSDVGGVAFLNACRTAQWGSPSSFYDSLRFVGYGGMIGTEHLTIDHFATKFGTDFLETFLGGEPVGKATHQLRGEGLLGLIYGTYCSPEIRVERSSSEPLPVALNAPSSELLNAIPLPKQPYPSLSYYDRKERALFSGRAADVQRFAKLLDEASTRIMVLQGESGVGKSSFLRAGLIPYLEEECLGYRFLRSPHESGEEDNPATHSVLFIRATNDPFGQLADALCSYCSQLLSYQSPTGDSNEIDLPGILRDMTGSFTDRSVVRTWLREDSSRLQQLLSALSKMLPFDLLVVIDQCEEVFTLVQSTEDLETQRLALRMLRNITFEPGKFKLILSLRTEYYGRLIDQLRVDSLDQMGIREYLLTDFGVARLIEAITRPVSKEPIPRALEVPFDKYGFSFEEGVPELIAESVSAHNIRRQDSALPLLQVIATQLYRAVSSRSDKRITHADFLALEGIDGAMRRHVEDVLDRNVSQESAEVKVLFAQLYLRQPDGSFTSALVPERELAVRWRGNLLFADLLDICQQSRLLLVSTLWIGGQPQRFISLGHDSISRLAAEWDEGLRGRTQSLIIGILGAKDNIATTAIREILPLRQYAFPILRGRFVDSFISHDTRVQAGIALVALGDWESARRMLRRGEDRSVRTRLIHAFPSLEVDLAGLLAVLRESDSADFQSGVCLALGLTCPRDKVIREELKTFFSSLYRTAKDGGTHGAAAWCFRQWSSERLRVEMSSPPSSNGDWYVNHLGMSMLKAPTGTFSVASDNDGSAGIEISLTRQFYMGNRQVSVDDFHRFTKTTGYSWEGHEVVVSPTGDCPVQRVTWDDAIAFCNWLSGEEGLDPHYVHASGEWNVMKGTTGYRLPTEAEWEWAARAGATTEFVDGIDQGLLGFYAVHWEDQDGREQPTATMPCTNKMPNNWGLFDMYGNVWEWCQDWYDERREDAPSTDPRTRLWHVPSNTWRLLP